MRPFLRRASPDKFPGRSHAQRPSQISCSPTVHAHGLCYDLAIKPCSLTVHGLWYDLAIKPCSPTVHAHGLCCALASKNMKQDFRRRAA